MLFLVGCSVLENSGYLLKAVFAGYRGEIGVFVARHALAGKGFLQVFLSLCALVLVGGMVRDIVGNLYLFEIRGRVQAYRTFEISR